MNATPHHGSMRGLRASALAAAMLLSLLVAGGADARLATITWTDPNPAPSPVVRFHLHVGTSPGTYGAIIDLGLPNPGAGGVYTASANVPDDVDVYMSMSAFEVTGLESNMSNEQVLAAPPPPPNDQLPNGQIDSPSGNVSITEGGSVFFTGSGSDPDGGNVTYFWDFDAVGSGVPPAMQPNPGSVTFPNSGTFLVSLTVTDDEGNPDPTPATVMVDVQASTPPPPPPPGGGAGFTGLRHVGRVTADASAAAAPPGDTRLFVASRGGVVRIVEGGYPRSTPFLDLSDLVSPTADGGILGLAFDPAYANNGYFFVTRVDAVGDMVLSRFSRGAHPYVADRASEVELLRVSLPHAGHPGGGLAFDQAGMLFVGLGDGGGSGDPGDRAQDGGELFGKLLRLDVAVPARFDSLPAGAYSIPADNPFVGVGGMRDEIWAMGLRDPAHVSVDRQTGALWVSDPGGGLREEINYESGSDAGGHNYGWDVTSGTVCNPDDPAPTPSCNDAGLTDPVFEYTANGSDCGIVGGHAYRGAQPDFQGEYFFADTCSGNVWSYHRGTDRLTSRTVQFVEDSGSSPIAVAIAEGGTGELYVLAADGRIHEIRGDVPVCRDGVDNDGDGLVDYPADPGCASPDAEVEVPLCDDGFDNDLDGETDLADTQCASRAQNVEAEPLSLEDIANEELFCGLGSEMVLIIPAFMWLRRAGRRTRRA